MDQGFIERFIYWVLENGGLYILLLVVFAETGLFVGFFLPGDALLFAAGLVLDHLAEEFFGLHFSFVVLLVILASVLGNIVGYWFGYKTGPVLFDKKDTLLFKRKHLIRARDFYDEYGKGTIFLAKFLPVIRTFAPIIAGIVQMKRSTFMFYNIVGSITWVCSMMLSGYYLETFFKKRFGFSLLEYIEPITFTIIGLTTLPVLYKLLFAKKKIVPTPPTDDYDPKP